MKVETKLNKSFIFTITLLHFVILLFSSQFLECQKIEIEKFGIFGFDPTLILKNIVSCKEKNQTTFF